MCMCSYLLCRRSSAADGSVMSSGAVPVPTDFPGDMRCVFRLCVFMCVRIHVTSSLPSSVHTVDTPHGGPRLLPAPRLRVNIDWRKVYRKCVRSTEVVLLCHLFGGSDVFERGGGGLFNVSGSSSGFFLSCSLVRVSSRGWREQRGGVINVPTGATVMFRFFVCSLVRLFWKGWRKQKKGGGCYLTYRFTFATFVPVVQVRGFSFLIFHTLSKHLCLMFFWFWVSRLGLVLRSPPALFPIKR